MYCTSMQSSETPAVGPADVPPTLTRRAEIPFPEEVVRDIDEALGTHPGGTVPQEVRLTGTLVDFRDGARTVDTRGGRALAGLRR